MGTNSNEIQANKDFPDFINLFSGNLELLYCGGDIRMIKAGGSLLLKSIYVAVRDRNWKTIDSTIIDEKIDITKSGFTIKLLKKYNYKEISFEAKITISGDGDSLIYRMEGVALSDFYRNRIGLCVLYPTEESKGKKIDVLHSDGSKTEGVFPILISSHQPYIDITGITLYPDNSMEAHMSFDGDIFEMEDQRNWTDASYKIYSTPLELEFPVFITKGAVIQQSVSFSFKKEKSVSETYTSRRNILRIDTMQSLPMPQFGIGKSFDVELLSLPVIKALSKMGFHHYRVDLWLYESNWRKVLNSALKEFEQLNWPFELAFHFDKNYIASFKEFLDYISGIQLPVSHFLIFDENYLSGDELLKYIVPHLKKIYPGVPVGGGTDAHFAELNRNHPDSALLDFVSFSICPQVHATDDVTIIENIEGQAGAVESAKILFQKPVYINAVTLKQRFNAVATVGRDVFGDSSYKPESDERQQAVFSAAWTLGSMKQLIMSGIESVTYYETMGSRGLLQNDGSPGDIRLKQNESLKMYPLYHLFNEVLGDDKYRVHPSYSNAMTKFDGLLLTNEKQGKLFMVNFTNSDQDIDITGMDANVMNCFELSEEGWHKMKKAVPDICKFTLGPKILYMFNIELKEY